MLAVAGGGDMTRANGVPSGPHEFAQDVAEVIRDPDATRIVLTGDLDMSTVARVRPIVESACERSPETVVLDLSAIEFVDSHGFRLLAATHRALTADGCVLVVLPPPAPVRRAFEITGLDHLFGEPPAE
jgi:anti-sigma B factor antagonist